MNMNGYVYILCLSAIIEGSFAKTHLLAQNEVIVSSCPPDTVHVILRVKFQAEDCIAESYRTLSMVCLLQNVCELPYSIFPCLEGSMNFDYECVKAEQIIDICAMNGQSIGPMEEIYIISPEYPASPEYATGKDCTVYLNNGSYSDIELLDISVEPRAQSGTGCMDRLMVKASHEIFGEDFQLDEVCGKDLYNVEGLNDVSTSWMRQKSVSLTFKTDANTQDTYRGFIARVTMSQEPTTQKMPDDTTTKVPSPCLSEPCGNNGYCLGDLNYYQCRCVNGYSGANCENPPRVSAGSVVKVGILMILPIFIQLAKPLF